MPGETLRVISSNTYRNRALNNPASLEQLLPDDDTPTIVAFQEVAHRHDQAEALIRQRGYQPILLASHGLALAMSPDLEVRDMQTLTYQGGRTSRKYGLQVVRTAVGDHEVLLGNGHVPVFSSPRWQAVARQDALAFGRLAIENTNSVIISTGDRNFVRQRQAQQYRQLQKAWGAQALLPENEPTYIVGAGKHRWMGWLRLLSNLQLDGIDIRIPDDTKLVNGSVDTEQQYGYEIETFCVASDHLAVQALLQFPAATLPTGPGDKVTSQEPG
ncbi:MAG TPA: hypothetical protein VK694_05015 [Verrucomicrobiae bacterium]|nr:hypothetical protein [Verrucomicrobiae bacterium]